MFPRRSLCCCVIMLRPGLAVRLATLDFAFVTKFRKDLKSTQLLSNLRLLLGIRNLLCQKKIDFHEARCDLITHRQKDVMHSSLQARKKQTFYVICQPQSHSLVELALQFPQCLRHGRPLQETAIPNALSLEFIENSKFTSHSGSACVRLVLGACEMLGRMKGSARGKRDLKRGRGG